MKDVLEDNGLKEFVEQEIPKPIVADARNFCQVEEVSIKGKVDNP